MTTEARPNQPSSIVNPQPSGVKAEHPGGLVLSRQIDEVIEIQDLRGNIIAQITVADIRGNKCRLHLKAGQDIKFFRKEIADEIRRHK